MSIVTSNFHLPFKNYQKLSHSTVHHGENGLIKMHRVCSFQSFSFGTVRKSFQGQHERKQEWRKKNDSARFQEKVLKHF